MSIFMFCGGDGTGKTAAAQFFSRFFEMPYVKFPYGSDGDQRASKYSGRVIREILNDTEHPCNPAAFQALQFVNKFETIPLVLALEEEYGVVFVDRWIPSARMYGEVDGVDKDWNESLCEVLDGMLQPTILFVFIGEPFRKDNDIYGDKQEKIRKLYENYCEAQANNPTIIRINIDGKSLEEVHTECLHYITTAILTKKQPGSIL